MIQTGAFVVSQWKDDPKQILFQTKIDVSATPEQLDLKSQVEQTLTALQIIFERDEKIYFSYFAQLLSLAQAGLVGPAAQPDVAKMALESFKADIIAREAGRIKNQYMKTLGSQALYFAIIAAVVGSCVYFLVGVNPLSAFCALWVGCMGGVWVSYGIRKTQMSFQDLSIPDVDRLEPSIRLIFAGILTFFLGFIFMKDAVVVNIANLKSGEVATDLITACIFGFACGISELALPAKVSQQAARFLDFK
jgi:hypothetical protein